MDWFSNIFDYFAPPTRLAWLSITITIFVAIISVKITNRFARKLSLTNPDALTGNREACDRLLDEARKLMGASRLRSASVFEEVTDEQLEQALISILRAVARCPRYARAHYEYGVYEILSQRPERAIPRMKKALTLEPKNARYQCALGQVYWESARSTYLRNGVAMGQSDVARPWAKLKLITHHFLSKRYFRKALKLDPDLYIANIRLGVAVGHQFKDQAKKLFEKALQLEPNEQTPYLNLIRLSFYHGDLADARVVAKRALKHHPDNSSIIKQLKKIYAAERNFEQLKELENLYPSFDDRSWNNQQEHSPTTTAYRRANTGSVFAIGSHPIVKRLRQYDQSVNTAVEHLLNDNMDDARDEFERLSIRYPDEPMYKLALADCALQSANPELATKFLNEAGPVAETDWYWRYICFSIAWKQQDFTRATELAKNWWNADNSNSQAMCMYCEALLANGNVSAALEILDNVVASKKSENSVLLSIAEIYLSLDKPDQAQQLLQSALESDPKDHKVHLVFCRLYQHQKHYSRMSDYAQSALTLGADRSLCFFYSAVSLANLGKTDEAIKIFLKCIELNPKKSSYHLHLGYAYADRLNNSLAKNAFITAGELSPRWDAPLFALGDLYLDVRDIVNALKTYDRLIKIKPHDSLAHFKLALCCERDKQRKHAIKHYKRAIELGDHHHVTCFNLGQLYEQKSYQLARKWYEKALAIEPTYAPALFNIGIQYMQHNRHEESLSYFKKAHRLDPDNTAFTERLAMAYHEAGHYETCIALANNIIANDPENFIGWDCLGKSYVVQQNIQAALQAFATAAQLSSNHRIEFLNRIGDIHVKTGNNDAALKCYTDIIKEYPDDAVAYVNIGNVNYECGNEHEAINWYNKASDKNPHDETPYFSRALIYHHREQHDAALEQLDIATRVNHQYALAHIFKGRILMEDKLDLKNAKTAFEQCLKVAPFNLLAMTRLAQVHNQLHDHEQALACAQQAIEIQEDSAEAHEQLLVACEALGRVEDGLHVRAQLKRLKKQVKNTAHELTEANILE